MRYTFFHLRQGRNTRKRRLIFLRQFRLPKIIITRRHCVNVLNFILGGGVNVDSQLSVKLARNGYIIVSLLFCLTGIWECTGLLTDIRLLCTLVGLLCITCGLIKMIGYFSNDLYCLAFQYDFAFGLLMSSVGCILLIRFQLLHPFIYNILGLIILTDSVFKIQMCMDAKRFGMHRLWWRLMMVAIATGVLGALILIRPFQVSFLLDRWFGYALISEGILNLLVAIFTVRVTKIHPL